MILNGAKIDGLVNMTGAIFDGPLYARTLEAGRVLMRSNFKDVVLSGAKITGDIDMEGGTFESVRLFGAKITGDILMTDATFDGPLDARLLKVDGSLNLNSPGHHVSRFKGVDLSWAKSTGLIDMSSASFDGTLNAKSLEAGGDLLMADGASFKEVKLDGAKIRGKLDMHGASFDGVLNAKSLQAGGDVLMYSNGENKASFKKEVNLDSAKITGKLDMNGASFDGPLNANSLQVGHYLSMVDAQCAQKVNLRDGHVGSNLNLHRAILADLDLTGATVVAELQLGGPYKSVPWTGSIGLTMLNTHAGNLMDAKEAWPAQGQLHLDGFSVGRLGGYAGETEPKKARGNGLVGQLGEARSRLQPRSLCATRRRIDERGRPRRRQ